MSHQQQLLIVWLTFAVLGSAAVIVALVWAVRSGQFAHQDRAGRLPLEAGIPEEETETAADTNTTATATASPRSAGGFNGKATATATASPRGAEGLGASPGGACVPPSSGTPLGGAEGDKTSPSDACGSAPAASARES